MALARRITERSLFGFSFPSRAAKADAAPDGADGQTLADPAALGTDATVES